MLVTALSTVGCGAPPPEGLGTLSEDTLRPCPETPNCVHTGLRHPPGTLPLRIRPELDPAEAFREVERVVESMDRTDVTHVEGRYLRAEARSRVFRFIDDLEVLLQPDGELVVRSASRVGRSDLGVNARRVEQLRGLLRGAGVLEE